MIKLIRKVWYPSNANIGNIFVELGNHVKFLITTYLQLVVSLGKKGSIALSFTRKKLGFQKLLIAFWQLSWTDKLVSLEKIRKVSVHNCR